MFCAQIVLFGDSITQQSFAPGGWGAAVANQYQRTADVTLRGYSGYNTRWALRLLPGLFPQSAVRTPALVTVLFGANDANLPPPLRGNHESASRQHVPIDEYIDNLRAIIDAVGQTGDGTAKLLLITPPPIDEKAWHAFCVDTYGVDRHADPNRSHKATKAYADAVVRVGKETGTPTLDLHAAFLDRGDWSACFRDGLHPNAAGGMLIGDAILAAIAAHFPDLRPGAFGEADYMHKLAIDFPDHKAIDVDAIDATFSTYEQQRLPPPRPKLGRLSTAAFFQKS